MKPHSYITWFGIGLIIAMLTLLPTAADIFKCVDSQGRVTFSGSACSPDAVRIRDTIETPKEQEHARKLNKDRELEKRIALVTLVDGSQIELITKTMYIYRGLTTSQTNTLNLPNGLRIPFLEIKKINIEPAADKSSVTMRVTKHDGAVISANVEKPWINIAGDNLLGRFAKPVIDIKSISFSS